MTGKKKLGQKRVVLLTSAQVSPAIGGNVLSEHYTILNLCGNAPVWLCDASHGIFASMIRADRRYFACSVLTTASPSACIRFRRPEKLRDPQKISPNKPAPYFGRCWRVGLKYSLALPT
ncbi:hypothetical protein DMB85_003085 [Pectobacterium aquaticum]|uniref:Uncharacterized protein n=1 Tax=Pectobacterium aquaticum TaxID=2204145 RepID=A0ABX9Z7M4_9GAMM|nr:hypothetical protein DMB79_015765 [Pectobacterium aquaticum]RRO01824.1 hypothetical protein DMB83_012475 [Pectobacterium aquaticum]RRO04424.1 hypothetical protein DMB81_017210 [Pectobacterium aquaticum]RRO11484.1 hypothetical protein DMB85_003085 [Pectobacterium aquaticum]